MQERLLLLPAVFLLLSGTAHAILLKAQDNTDFRYPYFQCATIFLGELLCLGVYAVLFKCSATTRDQFTKTYIVNQVEREQLLNDSGSDTGKDPLIKRLGFYIYTIPAAIDGLSTILSNLGLMLSTVSVYQMLRYGNCIFYFLTYIFVLKRRIFKHQVIGVALVLIGVALISAGTITMNEGINTSIGVFLLLSAQVVAGAAYFFDEVYLQKIMINPLLSIGIEGMAGLGFYIVLLPAFFWIPCSSTELCTNGHIEDSSSAINKIVTEFDLFSLWFGTMICVTIFSCCGILIQEKTSASKRAGIEILRTLSVWMVSISIGWEKFVWMQLLGFCFLLPGALLYSEVLKIPVLGLKESVEQSQEYVRSLKNWRRKQLGNELSFVFG
mmetsp:Transcript_7746/g.14697  ORF Transcript_7746/g.14697 Transcript_7746/m.14697 type:complete len:383 (+) Transcript_7746:84-1232(+)